MIKKIGIAAWLAGSITIACNRNVQNMMIAESDYTQTVIDSGWQFRATDSEQWYPARVPGVVHTDLLENGMIPEPYYSTNEDSLQWIEHKDWEYRTVFVPSPEQFAAAEIFLDFQGLDTYADVYLNGEKILEADNMFVDWRIPVKRLLKPEENTLEITFKSAYRIGSELAKQYPKLPADNDKGKEYKTSVFTRKAQYHFGWDWGPRFVTAGIWKPVYLESYNQLRIDNIQYVQLSQDSAQARIEAKITLDAAQPGKAELVIANENGVPYASRKVSVVPGMQTFTLPFVIENPELWWPNGMGMPKPTLYTLNTIVSSGGNKYDEDTQRIGIRTVELKREKDDVGETFYFEVNGVPLFMKGANLIPQDVFLPEVTPERYRKTVDVAVESNMNMLRVWGGGIYESDVFYDYCDEQGILVWQDFPFACAFYPWDDAFYDNVRKEARQNIRRLRNHPSLAIWCGNNEIDEAWHQWGYTKNNKDYPWSDEEKRLIRKGIDDLFFDKVIPGVLAEEDTTRPYHPSSPLYGWGNPKSQIAGDVHYWGVFHGEEPFSAYKDKPGRFSNEYGHQSLANYDTWKKWLKPDELKILSEAMHVHQKNGRGYRLIEDYMRREVPVVKDDFRTYVYLSQLVQADGIRIAMEGHRQNRPFTMGSLYWQLNDCWPVTSWSSMDYPFGYKALQYFAKNSFAPTLLSFDQEDKTRRVELWGITDRLTNQDGTYTLSLMDFNGNILWSENREAHIQANSSVKLLDESRENILKGADPKKVILVAEGEIDGQPVRSLCYFLPYKDLELPRADYEVKYHKNGPQVTATLKANNLLKAVLFEADVPQTNPSDAYFDMLPGETRTVTLHFETDEPENKLNIRVKTLNDLL